MKKIILPAEARARIARQLAETTGVTVVCGGQRASTTTAERDQFNVA